MKAYIVFKPPINGEHRAQVVTAQDYHERGPHAYSYEARSKSKLDASLQCAAWCSKNNCVLTTLAKAIR